MPARMALSVLPFVYPPAVGAVSSFTKLRALPPSTCWVSASGGNHWCGKTHPGQQSYNASSGEPYGTNWKQDGNGWRFCQLTLGQCKAACVGLGGCAELLVVESNGCCFPANEECVGTFRASDTKLLLRACDSPQESPPPTLPPLSLAPPPP